MDIKKMKEMSLWDITTLVIGIFSVTGLLFCYLQEDFTYRAPGYLLSYLLLFIFSFLVYRIIVRLSAKREKRAGLLIAVLITSVIFGSLDIFPPLAKWEEDSVYLRFRYSRPNNALFESEMDGNLVVSYVPPEKVRSDIQIIGITSDTINAINGKWPLPWKTYADIINVFAESDNVVMFDIFFLDYKLEQMSVLQEALTKAQNPVLFDYPMESRAELKTDIKNLKKRMAILRKRFRLQNVTDPDNIGRVLFSFPHPPIESVAELSQGLGFANVIKFDGEKSRAMPLIVKLENQGEAKQTEYYPSIALQVVCKYYGVDVVKDTEVRMGEYIKIKNIPKKELTRFNFQVKKLETRDIMTKPNSQREIKIPIDEYGLMQINYVGGFHSFRKHNLHEVARDWNEEYLFNNRVENQIFLVAMYYASGVNTPRDLHNSPFGEISGIEHHANAINTILNQDFMQETGRIWNLLLYLTIGLLLGFLSPRLPIWGGFLMITLMMITTGWLAFFVFRQFNLITPFPSLLVQQVVIFFSIIGYRIFAEEENVKYIRNTFSKFVSADVVNELLKDPSKIALGGTKREVTIFFSDIRGFTSISESLSPEELVQFLNEYLSAMTNIVLVYKGTIDKYMGDAIMAFWGAPIDLEDHAYYACVCALAQLETLKQMQAEWQKKNQPIIDIGIGLNSGQAVVGNMGSAYRMEYTCMGDTINLGSRLEGSNKMYGTNIIISEYTYEKVKQRIYARELDLVKVKGKNHPVRIYELMALKDQQDMQRIQKPLSQTKK